MSNPACRRGRLRRLFTLARRVARRVAQDRPRAAATRCAAPRRRAAQPARRQPSPRRRRRRPPPACGAGGMLTLGDPVAQPHRLGEDQHRPVAARPPPCAARGPGSRRTGGRPPRASAGRSSSRCRRSSGPGRSPRPSASSAIAVGLGLAVGVELDLAGVAAVLDDHPGGDDAVGAEHLADRLDHLRADELTITTSRPAAWCSSISVAASS